MSEEDRFTTSDSITCVVLFGRAMSSAIRGAARVGMTGYRILAYLGSHAEGATPGAMSAS